MKRLLSLIFVLAIICATLLLTSCFGPKHEMIAKTVVAPTCNSIGYTEYYCEHCDEEYIADFVDALEHQFDSGTPVKTEDCTSRGVYKNTCSLCGESYSYSVPAKGHSYVEVSEDGNVISYECEVCHDTVHLGADEMIEDYVGYIEVFDVEPNFTFKISTDLSEAEIREKLSVIDNFYHGTEYEEHEEVVVSYSLTSEGNGVWLVSAQTDYEFDTTYLAKVEKGVRFVDYRGNELSFTVKDDPEHTDTYDHTDSIVFLKQLEAESAGYYPYEIVAVDGARRLQLTLGKVDGLSKGLLLCVGDVVSFDEITPDTECYFGVVDEIINVSEGKWLVTLCEPDLQEVFEEFDISFNDDIDLGAAEIDVAQIEKDLTDALWADEGFVEFLSAINVSANKYFESKGYISPELSDVESFMSSVSIDPVVSVDNNKLTAQISGEVVLSIKDESGREVGTFTTEFDFDIESQFKIDVKYEIKNSLFVKKVEKFDIAITQSDDMSFDFAISIDADELTNGAKYVRNTNSGEVHLDCCIEVVRANDPSIFEEVSLGDIADAKKCEHCKPEGGESLRDDFKGYYIDTLYCSDWEKVASDIEKLTSTDEGGVGVDVKLTKVKIPVYGIVSVNLDLGFALSIDAHALMDYSFEHSQKSVYGMRLNYGYIQPYTQTSSGGLNENELSVLGDAEIKVGLLADAYVGISGLEAFFKAGVRAEVGAYSLISGVLVSEKDFSGAYFEGGTYIDIDVYYKFIGASDSADVLSTKKPLLKYGYEKLYFGYETYYDTLNIFGSYDIAENDLLAVKYYDLVDMVLKTDELLLSGGNKYQISVVLADGSYCEIVDGVIVYKKGGVPEIFNDKLIITVTSGDDWNRYRRGSAIYYLGVYEIDIVFDTNHRHSYSDWSVVKGANCFTSGEQTRSCTECGYVEREVIAQFEHNFIYNDAYDISICEYCQSAKYDGHIYEIFTNPSTWDSAKTQCEALGGHLVTITSEQEQGAVSRYMQLMSFGARTWLGGYKSNGIWYWVTGEALEYNHWNYGEPNNSGGSETAIEINYSVFAGWNDIKAWYEQCYICEWDVE